MNSRLLISLLVIAVARVSGADDLGGGEKEKDVIKDFNDVRAEIRAKLEAPISCTSYSEFSKTKKSCDFAGLCGFMNENHDRATLYRSPNGGLVPNYDVYRHEEASLKACYTKVLRKVHSPDDDKQARAIYDSKVLAHRSDVLKARSYFLATVSTHNESAVRDKIDLAATQLAIDESDEASKSGKPAAKTKPPRTAMDFDAVIARYEAKAKVHYSPETRAAYIRYLVKDAEPIAAFKAPGPNDKWATLTKDPFVDIALLYDPNEAGSAAAVTENQKLYQEKVDRAERIFDGTKASLTAFLEHSRNKTNGAQIDDMIKRVDMVRFRPQPLPVDSSICAGPNAFYSPSSHNFSICPQDLENPEESLRRTIAHEVGHSIDPCNVASPLVKIEGERNPVPKSETPPPAATGFLPYKPKKSDEGGPRLVVDGSGTLEQTLDSSYKSHTTETVAAGIGLPQNPFSTAISCLASPESVGARMASEQQAQKNLDEEIRRLRAQGATEENSDILNQMLRARKSLHQQFANKAACSSLSGNSEQSQMQESFADWLASKVVQEDLEKADEAKKRDLAFDSLTSRLASCNTAESTRHFNSAVGALLKKMGCSHPAPENSTAEFSNAIQNAQKATYDSHPGEADRVDRIFLTNPTIARAMGCAVKKGLKACE